MPWHKKTWKWIASHLGLIPGTLLWLALAFFYVRPRYSDLVTSAAPEPNTLDLLIIAVLISLLIPIIYDIESINIAGFQMKFRAKTDDAKEKVESPRATNDSKVIEYGRSETVVIKERIGGTFLTLKARINYRKVAGFSELMRIKVNEIYLGSTDLVNKGPEATLVDGRTFVWYNTVTKAWKIPYSPDFKSNYKHTTYGLEQGDPYEFIFDLNSVKSIHGDYKVVIEHNDPEGKEAHQNAIVIRDIDSLNS